jgi:hypothetical protein
MIEPNGAGVALGHPFWPNDNVTDNWGYTCGMILTVHNHYPHLFAIHYPHIWMLMAKPHIHMCECR